MVADEAAKTIVITSFLLPFCFGVGTGKFIFAKRKEWKTIDLLLPNNRPSAFSRTRLSNKLQNTKKGLGNQKDRQPLLVYYLRYVVIFMLFTYTKTRTFGDILNFHGVLQWLAFDINFMSINCNFRNPDRICIGQSTIL